MASLTRTALIAAAAASIAGLAAGCSSGNDGAASTTTTTAAASSSTTAASVGTLPAAPAGSVSLQKADTNGVVYQRWSLTGSTAEQVVSDYTSALTAQGYTVTDTGGGGGGWGKWGGAGAGLTAQKSSTFVAVQAGGQTNQPVYFEVCQGADQSAVDNCQNLSQGPDSNSNAS